MQIESRGAAPPNFPFAGKVFGIASMGTGKFVTATAANVELAANGGDIFDTICHFQMIRLPTGEVKLFSNHCGAFVSGVGEGWPLLPSVQDEPWSHFELNFIGSNATFTLRSTQTPQAQSSPYVSVVDASQHLRIAELRPRERWSYFQPYTLAGVPALNLEQWMP